MGYSITWLACPESRAEALLQRLGLKPTGETEEIPEAPITMFRPKAGWRILWVNRYDCDFLRPKTLADLSADTDLIRGLVEEHVMACTVESWSRGQCRWKLSHRGEDGPVGLEIEGAPPEVFGTIRRTYELKQENEGGRDAGVDYIFEIPLKTAEAITGFKHDEITEGDFEVLEQTKSGSSVFFQRLFSR